MPTAKVNDIEICYESFGHPEAPPALLVAGLGAQLTWWAPEFVTELVERGLRVIRFDNRDCGLSSKTPGPAPTIDDLEAVILGNSEPLYTLSTLAADAMGLLDHLEIERAHLVGASMGGMIVQTMAIEHPYRALSLTSIMSTTGDHSVGQPDPDVIEIFLSEPADQRDVAIEMSILSSRTTAGPLFDEAATRERATESYDRCFHPGGIAFQLAAINGSGDRTPGLSGLDVPTLVIHGRQDRLIDLSGGEATAAAVPGAELLVLNRMGHDMPRYYWPQIADAIIGIARHNTDV